MENDKIVKLWQKVFPNSMILISKACFGDSYFFKGKLAGDRNECPNRILENDVLNYMFSIEDGNYKEYQQSVYIKPENPLYYCYDRDKIRAKSIKNITEEKLLKRFNDIKALVVKNRDNFINLEFNINDKI